MIPPIASRWISRSGWLLTAGTIVTTASIVPVFVERPAFEWLDWLGVVGTLVAALVVRLASPSAFVLATIVGFLANTVFFALLFGFTVHAFERRRGRSLVQP